VLAKGNKGIINRKIPYVPSFNNTPAKITDPAVGASTCASGNQIWNGNMGTLTANEQKKQIHKTICVFSLNIFVIRT
jgi:alkaline phosphatase